jgi:hypothetical protein
VRAAGQAERAVLPALREAQVGPVVRAVQPAQQEQQGEPEVLRARQARPGERGVQPARMGPWERQVEQAALLAQREVLGAQAG